MPWIIKQDSRIVGTLPQYLYGSVRMSNRNHATRYACKADADRFAEVVAAGNTVCVITVEEF
ncbi:hypothetical protein AUR04nite_00300 [Glutamicibacter uratoxydans]|uniref:Uncharacterized protein n=1 Tax=Glutamicibacter uratoxydans TaxID=43667 RepID=A0A4Y4DMC4_GLUUR|nr:hypothetical protein AUR04nite_00300 [Glutamicibacter uratoxydans]